MYPSLISFHRIVLICLLNYAALAFDASPNRTNRLTLLGISSISFQHDPSGKSISPSPPVTSPPLSLKVDSIKAEIKSHVRDWLLPDIQSHATQTLTLSKTSTMDEINKMEILLKNNISRDIKDLVSKSMDQFMKDEMSRVNETMIQSINEIGNHQELLRGDVESRLSSVNESMNELLSNTSNAIAKSNSILAKVIKDINVTLANLQERSEANMTSINESIHQIEFKNFDYEKKQTIMNDNIIYLNESTSLALQNIDSRFQDTLNIVNADIANVNKSLLVALESGLSTSKDRVINETMALLHALNGSWVTLLESDINIAKQDIREEINKSTTHTHDRINSISEDVIKVASSFNQSFHQLSENTSRELNNLVEKSKLDVEVLRQDIHEANETSARAIAAIEMTEQSLINVSNSLQNMRLLWEKESDTIQHRINLTANAAADAYFLINEKIDHLEEEIRSETNASMTSLSLSLSAVATNTSQALREDRELHKLEMGVLTNNLEERIANISSALTLHSTMTNASLQSFSMSLKEELNAHRKEVDNAKLNFTHTTELLQSKFDDYLNKSHYLSLEREALLTAATEGKLIGHAEAVEVQIALAEEATKRKLRELEVRVDAAVDDLKGLAKLLSALQIEHASIASSHNLALSRISSMEADVKSLTQTLTHSALNLFSNATSFLMTHHTHTSPPPPPSPHPPNICDNVSEERVRQIVEEMLTKKGK